MARSVQVDVVVEGHDPGVPRYLVVPSSAVAHWRLGDDTTTVEGTLNGTPLGRRSLKRWDERRWFLELRDDWCRKAGVSTGDRVRLALELASTELPDELTKVLAESAAARSCWERMSASRKRLVREDVLAAKRPETRERRARRALVAD